MTLALIFDLDDTLYDQLQAFEYAYYQHFADSDMGVEALYRRFRAYSDEVFEATQNGRMTLSEMHVYRITEAVNEFDIALPEKKARAFQQDYEFAQQRIELSDTMRNLLSTLSTQPIVLGIITNGEADRQRAKIEALNLTQWIPESHIYISGAHQVSKPNRIIFDKVIEALELDPTSTFYVGDNFENDVVGAIDAGWQVVWFNRRNRPATKEGYQADRYVEREAELVDVIEQIIHAYH
ncbi:HAD family hydrolase [Staphylococcus canis]|uniref:HAD family hydrolase n=1 Tax=Staphylococcus canis TaxID=2724942 RepID=A0ABS0T6L6_9STAP|nr:HAD family hydrolase [Staphylococcus canis]